MGSDVMRKLINELNKASELYYNGKDSFLTDKEFDLKIEELKKLEQKEKIIYSNSPTIRVGSPVLSELKKVKISGKPMLSLDKVHSAEEIIDFDSSDDLIASVKCDGLSVRLVYEDTDLVSANTRGDGETGADITEHVKHFLNVPLKIAKIGRYVIDGEAVILQKDFDIINQNGEFKNPRNAASGALSLLDTSIVAKRRLSFIAWDIIEGRVTNHYRFDMEEAKELGFTVVPMLALNCTKIEKEEIDSINQDLTKIAEEKGIPQDGVVWRIDDYPTYISKGRTEHHFCGAVAWKPANIEVETKLIDIELSAGRTGVLTPVAIFEPVELLGSTVERASLHNLSVLNNILGVHPYRGQKIKIFKANLIIPQLSWGDIDENNIDWDNLIKFSTCPICGEPIEVEDNDGVITMWCSNSNCSGKLVNRLDHFCGTKGLDIKGLSKKTIEKLIDWGWINGLRDIYKLNEHKTEWESKTGFGKASVGKILDAIDKAGRHTTLEAFISAIGIPLVGVSVAKEICKYYDTWEDFRNAVGGDWTELEGFGPEMSKAINSFDYTEVDEIVNAEMVAFVQEESQSEETLAAAIQGKAFCVTGKVTHFKNRAELQADIEKNGGKLVSSVTSKTDYLITNTPESGTAKNVSAKKLGIPVITEEEYLNLKS